MKKTLAILLALMMTVGLAACGAPAAEETEDNRVVVDYEIDIPEGFEEQEIEGLELYCMNADGSNINMTVLDKTAADDASFEGITVEMLRETLQDGFLQTYEVEVNIEEDSLTQEPVCDFPAYQYTCSYELAGVPLEQLVVCINADKIYTITYTDATGEWMETFQNSAQNIQLVTEAGE